MGRLKKDHSGWSTSGKWLKYQEPSIVERTPTYRKKKKDTNRWCRGKSGQRHNYVLVEKYESKLFSWNKRVCSNCGKKKWD